MKHYVIDEATLQEVANYITNNPSPNLPVGVALNLIGKLQQLGEIAAPAETPPEDEKKEE